VNDTVVQALLVGLFALTCGLLALAWMGRRLGLAAAMLFGVAVSVWLLAVVAIASGFRGADDFAACGDDCSSYHYSVVIGVLAPPLLIALAAFAGLVVLEQRRRARRSQ
jgi:hypothetical protein